MGLQDLVDDCAEAMLVMMDREIQEAYITALSLRLVGMHTAIGNLAYDSTGPLRLQSVPVQIFDYTEDDDEEST